MSYHAFMLHPILSLCIALKKKIVDDINAPLHSDTIASRKSYEFLGKVETVSRYTHSCDEAF